ncbi:MAG: type II toxin-antitoxin system Rv0910 family toxin [Mycobacteriaceae bacterium]
MGYIEASKDLTASPHALWEVVSNLSTWGQWFTIHERWMEEPPTILSEGTKLVAKILMLGMANKIEWTVAAVEVPKKLVLVGTGMAGVKTEFSFSIEPLEAGSRITVSGEFEGALIKGALGKAVEKDGSKQLDESLVRLDDLALNGS